MASMPRFWNALRTLYRTVTTPHAPRTTAPRTTKAPRPQAPSRVPPRPPSYTNVRPKVVSPPPIPSQQPYVPAPVQPTLGPLDMGTKVKMISTAARNKVMLRITYGGVQRLVEPYSYRDFKTGRKLMAYCSVHSKIHAFSPEKIELMEITQIQFSPRWIVEI